MTPRLVTFDCAQTLVEVDWTVERFAQACAVDIGLKLPEEAFPRYRGLYFERLPEFLEINLRRDPIEGQAFWDRLAEDWLGEYGIDASHVAPLRASSDRLGFGANSILFKIYDDVVPCLDDLQARGIRVAVVSNWDYSLHRVLKMFDVHHRFEAVLASLEEGVEKPDPRFFHICLEKLGVAPEETVHVGDNPIDDVDGAVAAGIRPVLIDRSGTLPHSISTLRDLGRAIGWNG